MSTKHTAGKWVARPENIIVPINDSMSFLIADAPNATRAASWFANSSRIVDCVNACEGIADPSVVPEMMAALKSTLLRAPHRQGDCYSDDYAGKCICGREELGRLIDRAEGRTQ